MKFCCALKIKNLIKRFECSVKIKLLIKVQVYIKKLLDIYSLWNVKFYDYESYNILRGEVYEEKFCYSLIYF